jgi:type IV pilus assembly protein PilM
MAQRIVGLDIGTSAVRAVELTVGDGRPVLEASGQVGLPPGCVVDGEVRDNTQVVASLNRLWREGGFSIRRVHLGVAGLRAITREIDMPPVPPSELDEAVRFQADQVVPFPLDQTVLSSKVIAQYTDADGSPQLRVLVAAAHRELIDGVTGVAQAAGLTPVGIDLDTAALARALYDPSFTIGPEAIVSVGAGLTMVVIHERGVLQFVRTIDMGGESITKSLASALDLPIVDAEGLKRRLGQPEAHDTRAVSAVAGAVSELSGEIHNSIRYFASLPGRNAVSRVLVTGGGGRTVGLIPAIQQGMDMPVQPAAPLSQVDIDQLGITPAQAAEINPTLAVPVGLALPEPSGKTFNLLPQEIAIKAQERTVRRYCIAAVAVVAALLIGLTVWRVFTIQDKQKSVNSLAASNAEIQNVEIPKYNKAVQLQAQVTAQQAQLKPTVQAEINWLLVLNTISAYEPKSAVMAGISVTPSGTTSSSTSSSSSSSSSSSTATTPVAQTPVAQASSTVTVQSLPDVTLWGQTFTLCPILVSVIPSGTFAPADNGSVAFAVQMIIGSYALQTAPSPYTEPIP